MSELRAKGKNRANFGAGAAVTTGKRRRERIVMSHYVGNLHGRQVGGKQQPLSAAGWPARLISNSSLVV